MWLHVYIPHLRYVHAAQRKCAHLLPLQPLRPEKSNRRRSSLSRSSALPREKERFSLAHQPAYAGWRAAWFQIHALDHAGGARGPLVKGELRWPDGSSHNASITQDGTLVMRLRPTQPRAGLEELAAADAPAPVVVSASHRLTADEIASGVRGPVHGTVAPGNNGCLVSHVVSEVSPGGDLVCMHYGGAAAAGREEVLPRAEVQATAPALLAEFEERRRPKCAEVSAAALVSTLGNFFRRCEENDARVRLRISVARNGGILFPVREPGEVAEANALGSFLDSHVSALGAMSASLRAKLERLDAKPADDQNQIAPTG